MSSRVKRRKSRLQQDGLKLAAPFLLPSLIGMLVFSLLPLVISAFISLTDWNGLDQLLAPGMFQEHFIGLDNFKNILSSSEFWQVLGNTCYYIVLYIPIMLAASLSVAQLLSQSRKGVTAFRIIYYIPVLTSWVAASLIWKTVLSPEYGALNNLLAVFGIEGPGWLLDETWAMPAVVLVSVWKDMGFFGLILLSGMIGIDRGYYEAAELDGAGAWTKFRRITLPLMTPAIFYVLIVSLINAFQPVSYTHLQFANSSFCSVLRVQAPSKKREYPKARLIAFALGQQSQTELRLDFGVCILCLLYTSKKVFGL